ncbi:MAG: S41 family peptidase [Anaerolineae bacterium]
MKFSLRQSRWVSRLMTLVVISLFGTLIAAAQDGAPPAPITNDEGGPVAITGSVTYTNTYFTAGVSEPLVMLEDEAGFVDRNLGFLMPVSSQVLGQITSDFFTSPFTYSIELPIEPHGTYRDVDQNGSTDQGVQIYAVAYWTNTWGDPYLEERDLFGGGWSTAYASTNVSQDAATLNEIQGGKLLIYSPDDQQGFSSGFGEDGLLFTADDPIVTLPQGYTVVDLDTDPFTFDRSAHPVIDLIEPEATALDDYSGLSYTDAFDAMIEKFQNEYAFSEYKEIDYNALIAEFRPRFEAADANADPAAYELALRDFIWSIPDVHLGISGNTPASDEAFVTNTSGGLGLSMRETDDGSTIVTFITPGGPADLAGIQLGAEIVSFDGTPISDVVTNAIAYSAPFSTPWYERLQKLRYATRFPIGTDVQVEYQNPGDAEASTVTLTTVQENASLRASSFSRGLTGTELPVEYRLLDSGYMYVRIMSFFDDSQLSIRLWERMIDLLNQGQIPGLIIDMRQNGGGSGFLADQMAAYFFDEPLVIGSSQIYDSSTGNFESDPNRPDRFYPAPENMRYHGEIAVLVGPACVSACEFFSYDMTLQNRAAIVGMYPTAGGGGSVQEFEMPEGLFINFPIGRNLDVDGNIRIEGVGVPPTVQVPVTAETLLTGSDAILDAAVAHLDEVLGATPSAPEVAFTDGGTIAVGDSVSGDIAAGERVDYVLTPDATVTVTISLGDSEGALDTYLRVYADAGNLIAENDDKELGVDINSLVEGLNLEGGLTYTIEVGTYDDAASGTYTLEVTETP